MHYEWNVTRAEELESLLTSFEEQRTIFLHADGNDRKDAERQMKALGKQLVKAPKLAHATLALNHLVATGAGTGVEDKSQSSHVRDAWMENPVDDKAAVPDALGGLPLEDAAALASLPRNALLLRLDFRLDKPYMSKDDTAFHVLDNPVRKEWIFRVPAIASTSWKGALRAAFWQGGHDEKDPLVQRLFGFSLDDDDGQAGCLTFFPTYFEAKDVRIEMINPHDRAKGTGKQPIPFEAVRAGARGVFWLLYAPRDAAAAGFLAEDMRQIANALTDLLSVYGVGAKVSSGYGTARPESGRLFLRADIPPYSGSLPEPPALETSLPDPASPAVDPLDERLTPLLRDATGVTLSEQAFLKRVDDEWKPGWGKKPKGPREEWRRYVRWHRDHTPKAKSEPSTEAEPATEADTSRPASLFTVDFKNLTEVNDIAAYIGRHLSPAPPAGETAGEGTGGKEVVS